MSIPTGPMERSSGRGSFDHAVEYHQGGGQWWAECNDLPGWSAAADTKEELDRLVAEGIEFVTGRKGTFYTYWWQS